MKFVEKKLEKTADVSAAQGKTFREFHVLALMTVALVATVYFSVGFIVDIVVPRISFKTENKIFSRIDLGRGKRSERIEKYSNMLGKLAGKAGMPDMEFTLFEMDDAKMNAFAMPGGNIGVTSGLLDKLGKEDEVALAFVIGHELGHFKNRDHLRGLGKSIGLNVCLAVIFGAERNPLSDNLLFFMDKKYSRTQEEAADRFGIKLVYDVYGKTNGTTRLFEVLQQKDKTPEWAYMLYTHPSHRKRIRMIKKYAEKLSGGK